MSLYGALFAGVSGLKSQANKLGVISDNVSNVNTVGYKGGNGLFETLVTSSSATAAYSPGGVLGANRLLVSKQGLLQATDSATDIAISGNGFFVVNQNADGAGQVFYTRSGSFRADSTGNFRNASGFYLQAWPLDREGRLPGAAGNTTYTTSSANLNSLSVVNVQNLTGSAAATSNVSIGANLNSSQSIFPGAAGKITMDSLSTNNYQIAAKDIIVPSDVNHVARGDKMVVSTGNGLSFTYRYGGFTFSRNVTNATGADSGATLLTGSTTLTGNPFSFTPDSNVVTVTHANHGLADGAVITLSGNTENMAGITSSEFNGNFVVDVIDENTYTFEVASNASEATDVTANSVITSNGANATVQIDVGAPGLFSVGQSITVAGATATNGITINGTHTITAVNGTTVTWATTTTTPPVVAAHAFSMTSGANSTVTVNVGSTNSYVVGQQITIANADTINGVNPNGTWTVTAVAGSNVSFATTQTALNATIGAQAISFAAGANPAVTINMGGAHVYHIGDSITIAGAAEINGVDLNDTWTVTGVAGNNVTFIATGETSAAVALGSNPFTFPASTVNPTVTMDVGVGNGVNYQAGDSITIVSPNDPVNGLTLAGTYTIGTVVGNNITFTATGTSGVAVGALGGAGVTVYQNNGSGATPTTFQATGGGSSATNFATVGGGSSATAILAAGGGSAITSVTRPFSGRILDATNTETRFLSTTGTAGFTTAALKFNITTASTGTVTFSYTSASPDVRQKQFNNLSNLAAAINEVSGLSARVVNNQLYVGATDANAAVTFSNGSVIGTDGPPVQSGIDWVRELGLQDIVAGAGRFSSMEGLYKLAITDSGISASIENPLGAASLELNVDDPLDTIHFADSPVASTLAAFTSATPFGTTNGSTTVTVTHPASHGFASGDFVTLNAATLANTQTLATNNPITTTTGADPTVTVNITGSGQTYIAGQLITIAGASAVNGVDVNGTWEVVTASATSVTFVATGETAGATTAGGGAAVTTSYGSFNGIPLADFSGRFEVTVTGATTYTIEVASEATVSGSIGAAGLLVTPHNNLGSLVAELGLVDSLNTATYTPQSTDDFGPAYSPTDTALNMASGNVSSHFSRPIRIYDAQGGGHDLNVAFLKTDVNTWAIEVYAVPDSDVSSSLPDGLVAYGNVTFNGDGTLRSVDTTLSGDSAITWTNGASSSTVVFDWGTAGQPFGTVGATTFGEANGLSQYNAAYKVSFANQNGAPVGELTGVSITELGVVVASYSNGQTQALYKIPLADFANPDELASSTGNVFAQSADSGEFNLRQAGTSGVGKIAASSLEASNVELSSELTDMIIAQRSYQANAKVISTSDSMLEELNRIIQ